MIAEMSLVANLQRIAQRTPGACAIQQGDLRTSYAELLIAASAVAQELKSHSCNRGDRVAIAMANSAEFVAAYYGALMVGGTVVLLNPAAKDRDFAAWMKNCSPRFLFADATNEEVARAATSVDAAPLLYQSSSASREPFGLAKSGAFEPLKTDAQRPACIMYTSGTTGHPKGVVLSHENLVSNTEAIVEYLQLRAEDSSVTVLPFYYAYGSSVLHTHIQAGARLVIEPNLVYPHKVVETLARERATGFAGVPSTFALLLARVKLADYDLSTLRYVTQAGGAMSPALAERLKSALPAARVFVMYGQTEATARLTYLPPEKLAAKSGSVGLPIAGVSIEIRGEHGSPLPAEQVGEVWASGPNIMLGYWQNDEATREVKVDGWLRTGDLGRLDEEGYLFLVGRRSDMIKAGAHRIHPQDIEDVISELPAVEEVAVVGVDDELLGQVIKAFIVLSADASATPLQIQAHCRARLANYKVPKTIEFVGSLPRTSSGKIRRVDLAQRTQ